MEERASARRPLALPRTHPNARNTRSQPRRTPCACFLSQNKGEPASAERAQSRTPMARIVMKFGGTSVADLDRIRNVASACAPGGNGR